MWRRILKPAAAGLLATLGVASVPGSADSPPPPVKVPDSAAQIITQYERAMTSGRFADALTSLDKMQLDSANSKGRALVDVMRASALLGLKRDAEAQKLIAESDKLAPQMPEASTGLFLGALLTNHLEIAADALDRMIARFPDVVREVDWQAMRYFIINEPKTDKKRNDDRRIALAQLGYGGDTERGHYMAKGAVDLLVERGDFTAANELLPYVKEPQAVENMLIQKRFAPLWPRLEELAGPHLAKVRDAAVTAAEREYEATPSDEQALANYANTLRHSGRLDDAIALRSKLPASSAAMSSADEDMGWAVNNVAVALHEAGRKEEADQLFALLNDASMPKEYWRVSMKINRLEFLVFDGRFEKALELMEPTAKVEGSPYAEQLVRRLRYCTLSQLGRTGEADKYKVDLLAHASDAPGPTIDALLCAGDVDGAERVAMTALANPDVEKRTDFEQDFVRQLQQHQLTGDDPSVWQGRWAELRKRPAIAAAFDRLGRDMPAALLPSEAK